MDGSDPDIAGIASIVLIALAVGIYVGAFVILSPTMGWARERNPSVIIVYSRYPNSAANNLRGKLVSDRAKNAS